MKDIIEMIERKEEKGSRERIDIFLIQIDREINDISYYHI